MKVFLGWDSREAEAYKVAEWSIQKRCGGIADIIPLNSRKLELSGLLRRPTDMRKKVKGKVHTNGAIIPREITAAQSKQRWDVISDAPMSTEFANSRFLAFILGQCGWVAFGDCDIVALCDLRELFALADDRYAVMCVKHGHLSGTAPKMDGQIQTVYARKNWSSLMLINCDHPANLALTLEKINTLPGRDLHRFCWLHDDLIGALPPEWNWLVGVQPMPKVPKVAHFTLGGPWLPSWSPQPYDGIWLSAQDNFRARFGTDHARGSQVAMPNR